MLKGVVHRALDKFSDKLPRFISNNLVQGILHLKGKHFYLSMKLCFDFHSFDILKVTALCHNKLWKTKISKTHHLDTIAMKY